MASFGEGGSYSGHLRLRAQVDVGDPGATTTSVTVRLRVWVETDGWNFADSQTVSYSGWKSGSVNFNNNLTSGDKLVVDRSWAHPVGSSRVNQSFTAKLSGNNATGSSPSVKVAWSVAGKSARPPDPPALASMGVAREGGSDWEPTHRVYWGYTTDNGGDPVSTWTLQIDDFDNFVTPIAGVNTEGGVRYYITGTILPGGRYWYRVRGTNSAGAGEWKTAIFDAPAVAPQTPNLDATSSIGKTTATLNWSERNNGGAEVTKSEVDVRRASDLATVYSEAVISGADSRVVTDLEPGTAYDYRVRLSNTAGYGAWSAWSNRFTTDFSEPGNRPTLSVSIIDTTSVLMSWTQDMQAGETALSGFDYQVSLLPDFSVLFASGSLTAGSTWRQIAGLTPATQYYFRVRAKNSIGEGPWSAIKSLTPPQGVRVYLNGSWAAKPLYVWDGSEWTVPTAIRVRSGGAWVDAG